MRIFKFCPQQEGYSFQKGNNIREQALEGGMPRQVVKYVGAVHRVTAQIFAKSPMERQLFWAFYRQNETKLWRWKLELDNGVLEDCVCQFSAENPPTTSMIDGLKRKFTINVYVLPLPRDDEFDSMLLDMWETGLIDNLYGIERIPNVMLPKALGV